MNRHPLTIHAISSYRHTTPNGTTYRYISGDWTWPATSKDTQIDDYTDKATAHDLTQSLYEPSTAPDPASNRISALDATPTKSNAKPVPVTGVVLKGGKTLTISDGMVYKLRRKNNKFNTYVCTYSCLKGAPSIGCGKQICWYPNGKSFPVGDDEHIFKCCYSLSNVEPPANLLNTSPKIVSIFNEIKTD